MKKEDFQTGLDLLEQPVLPLVAMVQFLHQLGGPEAKVEDIIAEMTEPVETAYTVYTEPDTLLRRYLDHLRLLEEDETEAEAVNAVYVIDESGQPVDAVTARAALISQRILEKELEEINSRLCAPCNCTLCCVGPESGMHQEFFEIPLQEKETELFALPRHDTPAGRSSSAMDEPALSVDGHPFYQAADQDQCGAPKLFHWQNGWSMILPKESSCPALGENGRCEVYSERPQVCRRPQIFSYILEPTENGKYMVRNSLLAVTDCPYVQLFQEEIAAYAAACELNCILKANKG